MAVIKNRDIIVVSMQAWDIEIGSTIKYTAAELAKNNRVLFVNQPVKRKYLLKPDGTEETAKRIRVRKGIDAEVEKVQENLWVLNPKTVSESISFIKNKTVFDFFNKLNDKRATKRINLAIKELNFKNFILINDNSIYHWFYLKEMLKPSMYIFLLRDFITTDNYHNAHGSRLQAKLIEKIDLTVTNCYFFQDYARKYNPEAYFVGQGCNLELFDGEKEFKKPKDMEGIPSPIIGFTGALRTLRLDINILEHIAVNRSDYSVVLVGPEDEDFEKSALHDLKNVYFLGRKDPEELPIYIKYFDVALNPQTINEITDINYPLKIDEYLALGIPTIATKTTFMNNYFSEDVYLPSTNEEYVELIDQALEENSEALIAKRKKVAKSHSWGHFVDKIFTQALRIEDAKKS